MAEIGKNELARRLGVSRQRINELARLGKITKVGRGRWDPEQVARQLRLNLDPQQAPKAVAGPRSPLGRDPEAMPMGSSHELFNRARAAKEMAIAKEKQLELKKREGQLLERDDVRRTWAAGLTAFKNRLLLIPDRLAPKVAALGGVLECREAIYSEVVELLQSLNQMTPADLVDVEKADVA